MEHCHAILMIVARRRVVVGLSCTGADSSTLAGK
jgi:hypothetical protein